MATGSFPNETYRRRTILILDEPSIEKCQYDDRSRSLLTDTETYILPIEGVDSNHKAYQNLVNSDNIRPGAVLVQSPYNPDEYIEQDDAEKVFALKKHTLFSTLCSLLGAKEVKIDQTYVKEKSEQKSGDLSADIKAVSVKGSVCKDDFESIKNGLSYHDIFPGAEPDIEAAENHLTRHRLLGDAALTSLLDMRRHSANRIQQRTLEISLTSESKKNLKIALGVKSKLPSVAGGDIGVSSTTNERSELIIKTTVIF